MSSKPVIIIDVDEAAKLLASFLRASPWLGLVGPAPAAAVKKKKARTK